MMDKREKKLVTREELDRAMESQRVAAKREAYRIARKIAWARIGSIALAIVGVLSMSSASSSLDDLDSYVGLSTGASYIWPMIGMIASASMITLGIIFFFGSLAPRFFDDELR